MFVIDPEQNPTCLITGLPAKYKDPKTGIPYANKEAYKILQNAARHGYVWSNTLNAYCHDVAQVLPRGVPAGMAEALIGCQQVGEGIVSKDGDLVSAGIPGGGIMPHAETDLAIPWAIVCLLLLITGVYGFWAVTKGSTWHHRQFVSASWGFLLMYLCWAIVYIAVEEHHVDKVNTGCMNRNPSWTLQKCDDSRERAALIAIITTVIGMVLGIYCTLVVSKWVTGIEWEEHLDEERRLEQWRSGHGENPHIKEHFVVDGRPSQEMS
ncbi:hypothetical protein BG004_001100 [Podila humilis]|nr:hypothetical protein BG004_001100 [Podila humilis]